MRKKFFIGIFILATIGLFTFAYIVLKDNNSKYEPQMSLQAPIEIPEKSVIKYEEALKIDKPMVVMFYVDWCGYCRKYMPVFAKFAKKYKDKYSYVAINCDNSDYEKMVIDYHIMAFPSLFIVDKKINHKFTLGAASMMNEKIMNEELQDYLNVRKNFVK